MELKCINNMQVTPSNCVKPCSGLTVTSFIKSELKKKMEDVLPIYEAYNNYKKATLYPLFSSGKYLPLKKYVLLCLYHFFQSMSGRTILDL